jgi:hypothetical protein
VEAVIVERVSVGFPPTAAAADGSRNKYDSIETLLSGTDS